MQDIRDAARWDCEGYTHSRTPTRTSTRSLHGGMNKEAFVGGNEEERAGKEEQRAALRNPKLIWRQQRSFNLGRRCEGKTTYPGIPGATK